MEKIRPVKKQGVWRFSVADQYQAILRIVARINPYIAPNHPDFLCIGAPRSGTSWLFRHLKQHPDVFMPWFKEVHFLDEAVNPEEVLRLRHHYDLHDEASWRWYSMVFAGGGAKLKGDITPAYMLMSKERIQLVKERMPDLRLIYIMRNPIERAWSGVRRSLWAEHGIKPSDVKDIQELREAVFAGPIVRRGDYRSAIENWESAFPNQIHYLFFEDVLAEPKRCLNGIANYLGIAPFPNLDRQNPGQKVNSAPFEEPPESIRQELIALYTPQVEYLQQRFGRDLSHWLEFDAPSED